MLLGRNLDDMTEFNSLDRVLFVGLLLEERADLF
jgi:hypothetical protein